MSRTYKIFRTVFLPMFRFIYRPQIINREYIPKEGAAVIAGNHKHALDPVLVDICTKRMVYTLAKKELHEGIFGFFFRAVGTIPVDLHSATNKPASHAAVRKLKEGQLINLSPEAKRNYTEELLLPFKYGAVSMAKKCCCPVIPYAITGQYRLFSKNLKIVFGPPVSVEGLETEEANRLLFEAVKCKLKESMEESELARKKDSVYKGVTNETRHRDSAVSGIS